MKDTNLRPKAAGSSSGELLAIARFRLHAGRSEDFKQLSHQCLEIARTREPGTLQYDIYLSRDETEAVVIERYRDSAALLEHLANVNPLMEAITDTGSVEGETLGEPSDELRELMSGFPVRLYGPYQTL